MPRQPSQSLDWSAPHSGYGRRIPHRGSGTSRSRQCSDKGPSGNGSRRARTATNAVDWPETARENVGMLHLYASHHPHDPRLAQLVGELSVSDRDCRRWWADHDVYQPQHGSKRYHHPLVGDLTLGFEASLLS
ncbi:hypothetical protein [Streptomyces sp. NPDC127197]|uniref:MmyB family transcriptional regulator n=1 Tax=Streptomyces sp. NPDC127197 TaxID=3345388 RepID=UPI00363D8203